MPINYAALEAAQNTFETIADGVFQQQRPSQGLERFCEIEGSPSAMSHTLIQHGAVPAFERWDGERPESGMRVYTKDCPNKTYATPLVPIDRKRLEYDPSGVVRSAAQKLLADVPYLADKLAFEALDANVSGLDGVPLLSSSHPHGSGGGTWDNTTTNALSFDAVDTGRAFGRNLQDEFDEYLGIEYDTLLVPPASERTALEIMQADQRPVAVATDGTINSGGIGGSAITNVYRGIATVVVSPRLTAGTWYLVDSRYKPIWLGQWSGPRATFDTSPDREERIRKDRFFAGVDQDIAAYGFQPHGIYGNPA